MNHRPTDRPARARRLGRTVRAGSPDRLVATAITAVPFLVLLALLLAVGAAWAQEMPGGMKVGGGEVSIEDGGVYAGNGCAKALNVTAGDCEKGGKDEEGDAGSSGEQAGDEAPETTTQETTQLLTDMEGTTTGFGESASPAPEPEATPAPAPEDTASSSPAPEEGCAAEGPMGETTPATVEEVVDGDTLETSEGTVRLIGVDTPETVDPDQPPEPGGEEASDFTTEALEGEEVELEIGEDPEDDYDRTLAYAWTDEGMFNERLLAEGYGELLIIEPNSAYEECLAAAESAAKEAGLGVWSEGSASPEATDAATTTLETTAENTAAPEDERGEENGREGLLGRLFGGGDDEQPEEEAAPASAPATTGLTVLDPSLSGSSSDEQYDEEQPAADEPDVQDNEVQQEETQQEETQQAEIQEEEIQEEEVQEPEVQEPETQEGQLPSSSPEPAPQETATPAPPVAEPAPEPAAEPAVLQTPTDVSSASPAASPAPTQTISTLPETGGPSPALLALPFVGAGLAAAGALILLLSHRRRAADHG